MHRCKICNEVKPEKDFVQSMSFATGKFYATFRCKKCTAKRHKKAHHRYRQIHYDILKERRKEYNKKYRQKMKEKKKGWIR